MKIFHRIFIFFPFFLIPNNILAQDNFFSFDQPLCSNALSKARSRSISNDSFSTNDSYQDIFSNEASKKEPSSKELLAYHVENMINLSYLYQKSIPNSTYTKPLYELFLKNREEKQKYMEKEGFDIFPLEIKGNDKTIPAVIFTKKNDDTLDIVISFRGSLTSSDWKTNIDYTAIDASKNFLLLENGKLPGGFTKKYETIRPKLFKNLEEIVKQPYKNINIMTTGHSQGGALATIALVDLVKNWKDETKKNYPSAHFSWKGIFFSSPLIAMGKKTQESIHHLVGKNNMIHVFSPYDFFTKHYLTKTFMEKIYCRHDLWGVGVEYPIDLMKLKALKTSSLLMQPKDQSDDFINLSLFQKFKNSCKKGYRSIYNHLNFKEKIQNLFKNTFDFICEHHFVGTEPHSSFEMPENTGWWPINGEI